MNSTGQNGQSGAGVAAAWQRGRWGWKNLHHGANLAARAGLSLLGMILSALSLVAFRSRGFEIDRAGSTKKISSGEGKFSQAYTAFRAVISGDKPTRGRL